MCKAGLPDGVRRVFQLHVRMLIASGYLVKIGCPEHGGCNTFFISRKEGVISGGKLLKPVT
jgi:hypothetical protein